MSYEAINFGKKFRLFDEQWQPKVIAEMNDYQFKIVKLQGDFIWHDHKNTDETFIVLAGVLRIDFRDGSQRVGGRNVCHSERRRTQALCRTRGQAIADRAARSPQYGP
jgi:mannose-6-phosphate isomerase-like protein (cupin superfamily)